MNPGLRADRDRDHGAEKDNRNLGPDADAQPDDDERQERDPRHGVERVDERTQKIAQTFGQPAREAERDCEGGRRAVTNAKFACAHGKIVPEIAIAHQGVAGQCHAARGGDEQRIDEAAASQCFPHQQKRKQRAGADQQAFRFELEAGERRKGQMTLVDVSCRHG